MLAAIANHLWQSTLFTLACAALALVLRRDAARVRHWLWVTASIKFLIPFAALEAIGAWLAGSTPAANVFADWSNAIATVSRPVADTAAPWFLLGSLGAAWLLGSAVLSYRWVAHSAGVRALLRSTEPWTGPDLSLPAGLPVRSAARLMEPAVVGIFRPALVLPMDIESHLTRAQLATVVAHEIGHWRRRDNLTAAMHRIVESAFWFHPLVWWIGARLLDEREQACDEVVVAAGHERADYAEAVLRICESYVAAPARLAAGVGGGPGLKRRITDIMRRPKMLRLTAWKKALLGAAAVAAVAVPVLSGLLTYRAALAQERDQLLPIVKVAPVYPPEAVRLGLEGHVVVQYRIETTGSVKDAFVVESSASIFEASALESALKFKYEPRVENGVPVEVHGVRSIIRFELEE